MTWSRIGRPSWAVLGALGGIPDDPAHAFLVRGTHPAGRMAPPALGGHVRVRLWRDDGGRPGALGRGQAMTWEALADWLLLGSAVLGIVYVIWDELRARMGS